MRIIVTELPKEASECLYSIRPFILTEEDRLKLPKCSFKVNSAVGNFPSWSTTPNKYTCDLCGGKKCPYLTSFLINGSPMTGTSFSYNPGVKHERKM